MYWRVRKIDPGEVFKQYGVHMCLLVSMFANFVLITTRPATPKMAIETSAAVENLVRHVTQHLLDTSYITYADSTNALTNGELSPRAIEKLRQSGVMIPKTYDELRAQGQKLEEAREVACVRIEKIDAQEATPKDPRIPFIVKGKVAIRSSQEGGPTEPVPFVFRYLIGAKAGEDGQQVLENGLPVPIVDDVQDLSPKSDN
jgi:hypothetical protein